MGKIKFKFYEKKGNSYEPRLSGFPKSYLVDGEGSVFLNISINKIGYSVDYLTYSSDVIATQSTGLKDKNGTEVYQGYVVEVSNLGLCEVVFAHGAFMLQRQSFLGLLNSYIIDSEVVGNIYENPELLGGKND